jgi:hypothetical protein
VTERNGCQLARFSDTPCDGELVRVHLIPKQRLRKELPPESYQAAVIHPAVWVWACGGPTGIGGHHGELDYSRKLRVPREALPPLTEAWAAFHGLTWWLTREYGPA